MNSWSKSFYNAKNIPIIYLSRFDVDEFNCNTEDCFATRDLESPMFKEGIIILTSNSNVDIIIEKFKHNDTNSYRNLIFDPKEISEEIEITDIEELQNRNYAFSLLYNDSIIGRTFMTINFTFKIENETNEPDCKFDSYEN